MTILRLIPPLLRSLSWLLLAYMILLAVQAWLGHWDPAFISGRDLWHFWATRMIVPMVMLAFFAAFARLIPSALFLAAALIFIGTISLIKKEATGEPFQVSDLFLAGQGGALLSYVSWDKWLMGALIFPAGVWYLWNLRLRKWSLPVALLCAGLLSTYRLEAVVNFIHDEMGPWGLENLTFSQAESERMNGLATHLYFSTAGLVLQSYTAEQVAEALANLEVAPIATSDSPPPDVYVILGEAWWRDPSDPASPFDRLKGDGVIETHAISPIYGGTTPNAEFEVLTAVPVKHFRSGTIPYQHFMGYFGEHTVSLPRQLAGKGFDTHAYHNFTARYWLRDQVYPRLGFQSFDSAEEMGLRLKQNGWPSDEKLYAKVLSRVDAAEAPQFHFIVTVMTHGAYAPGGDCGLPDPKGACDYRKRLDGAVTEFQKFIAGLKARGRPYLVLAFGDHLPGLRDHQTAIGIGGQKDPRLHQVPILIHGAGTDAAGLAARVTGKPLYCVGPLLADSLKLGIADPYYRHMVLECGKDEPAMPSDLLVNHQLFN